MKIRTCFVSNSSSSSFTCDVCHDSEISWDGLPDEWYQCLNEHTLCREEPLPDESSEMEFSRYEMPKELCPICQFREMSNPDMARYLLKETKITRDEIFQEIKQLNRRRRVLRDHEYVEAVCRRIGKTGDQLLAEVKARFEGDYDRFIDHFVKEETQ